MKGTILTALTLEITLIRQYNARIRARLALCLPWLIRGIVTLEDVELRFTARKTCGVT